MKKPSRPSQQAILDSTPPKTEALTDPLLEEYKLAVLIQHNYHDVTHKTVTIFITITAISLAFTFRESVFTQLKIIFCWFNLAFSVFFIISYFGFYVISKRIARRMDVLAKKLSFNLKNHHALSYGVFLTLLSGMGCSSSGS